MTHIVRLLSRSSVVACLIAALAGGAFAAICARAVALSSARSDVDSYADDLLGRSETIVRETNAALAEANHVEGEACGAVDLGHLRKITFTSTYIKDIGRFVNDKLACTSFLGIINMPIASPPPDISTINGYKLWANAPLRLADGVSALVVRYGNANAVINPSAFLDLVDLPLKYSIAIINPEKKLVLRSWGRRLVDDNTFMARSDISLDTAEDLIRVRCSKEYFICAAAALSRDDVLIRQSTFIVGFGAFGAGIGFASAFGLLLYRTRRPLTARLAAALRSNQLTVVFQPIVDLPSGRMVSAEALVRWTDNEGNTIPPDVFVAAAENNGTAGEITTYVIRRVCRDAGPMLRSHPDLVITVNIVADDLSDPTFYKNLDESLEGSGIARKQVGLELTERSTAHHDISVPAIARLRQLGHPVYLDDFGTGYSSLANLNELNVDFIKLDMAFTNSVGTGSVKVSIVPQILEMAKALGLGVVVEGIETETQYAYFASATPRCTGQGWYISRPMPIKALMELRAKSNDTAACDIHP